MATKNIRDIVVKVSGKDLTTAARDSEKLNKNLEAVISTVKGAGRGFKSINTALESMASHMKAVNSSMSASKVRTKGLETYQARMKELNKTLVTVKNTAENTSKALKSVNRSTGATGGTSELADKLNQVVIGLDRIEERIRVSNIQLRAMEENTGKTAKRLKATRDATNATSEAMGEFSRNTSRASKSADSYNNSVRGMAGGGRNQARAFSELAFSMNPLTSLYASIAINVYALSEAFRVLNEAANFDRLQSQTASFSAAVSGINVKGLAREMSELSAGVLSVRESMQFATKGAAFNFTSEQLERLTVGARKASIALGRDFNDSMDRVLRGISKQEIELFDELGVVTRLTPAFEEYAASVGKSVDQLSDYERQLALTIEVEKQLSTKFSGIEVQATAWEELSVTVKNTTDNILIGLSRSLKPLAEATTGLLKMVDSSNELNRAVADLAESQDIFNKSMEGDNLGQAIVAYSEMVKASEAMKNSNEDLSESVNTARKNTENLTVALQLAAGAATFMASKSILAVVVPAVASSARAIKIATTSVVGFYTALRAINFGVISSGIIAIAGGFATLTKAIAASTVAMVSNPLFWIIGGALVAGGLAAFALFGEEIKSIANSIMELIPGIDSTTQALNKQNEASKDSDLIMQEYARSLSKAGVAVGALTQEQIAKMGNALKANSRDRKQAISDFTALATAANKTQGPFGEFLDKAMSLRETAITASIQDIPKVMEQAREEFEAMKDTLKLQDSNIDSFDKLASFLDRLNKQGENLAFNLSKAANNSTLYGEDEVSSLKTQVSMQEAFLFNLKKVPGITKQQVKAKEEEIALLNQELDIAKENRKISRANFKNTISSIRFESAGLGVYREQYKLTSQELAEQTALLEAQKLATTVNGKDVLIQQEKVEALRKQVNYEEKLAALQEARRQADAAEFITSSVNNQERTTETMGGRRLNEVNEAERRVEEASAKLATLNAEFAVANNDGTDDQALAKLSQEIDNAAFDERIAKAKQEAAEYRNIASAIGEVAGAVPGLTSIQSQFIDMSNTIANTMSNVTELIANNQELTLSDFSDSIIAVGTMASSMFSELTKGVVADIDAQIAAEKKRDGKSQESLAKIQALEKKKIKEQEKSKIAQTAMSTSLAIMKTMAEVPWPANLAMAAGIGAMGMMQINNIKKASAGQMAALESSGAGGLSVSVGSRNNAVDVSQAASMGELSYLRGESGMGTGANNFTPGRAGGGSVTVGERGPETIRPTQPIYVEPTSSNDESSSKPSTINQNTINVMAMDSQSIIDRSDDIWESLEKAANSRGFTLQSLN